MELVSLFIFIFGLFLGSFLLVISDRSIKNESFFWGRSHCDHCNHILQWYELIPIISFLILRGKCRSCKKKISFWYPFSELLTGLLLALTFFVISGSVQPILSVLYMWFMAGLLVIFFTDWRYGIIPFPVVGILFLLSMVIFLLQGPVVLIPHAISAMISAGLFLTIFLLTKGRGMGFGDVVYAFLMGFILGFPGIVIGLYVAFLTGAVVSLILVLLKKKRLHGDTIPFGPFLVFGTIVVLLWGRSVEHLVIQYLSFF